MSASRLYRRLGMTSGPLFAFYSDNLSLYDDLISGVTIRRGKPDRGGGVHASTLELSAYAKTPLRRNAQNCRFFLRQPLVDRLTALTGVPADDLAVRFEGRLGAEDVDDSGDDRLLRLTEYASSWSAQSPQSGKLYSLASGLTVATAISEITGPTRYTVTPLGLFDTLAEPLSGTYADLIGKLTTDVGVLVRELRGGNAVEILPVQHRVEAGQAAIGDLPPLTRGQALAPSRWGQHNEFTANVYRVSRIGADGSLETSDFSSGTLDPQFSVVEVDLTYIKADTAQIGDEYRGKVTAEGASKYTLPAVTVDLLQLLSSPVEYDRIVARMILDLNPGDPVFFAADWPEMLQGVHFAEGLIETLTPDKWEVTLELQPWEYVTGGTTPRPNGWTWDTLYPTAWDSAPGTWDTFNATTK